MCRLQFPRFPARSSLCIRLASPGRRGPFRPGPAGVSPRPGCWSATLVVSPRSFSRSNRSRPIFACEYDAGLPPVPPGRPASVRIVVREVQLPLAAADRLQLLAPVEEVRPRAATSRPGWPDISGQMSVAVDLAILGQLGADQSRRSSAAGRSSWPARGRRLPAGIRPGQRMMHGTRTPPSQPWSLALAQRPGRAGVVAVGQPRAVVRGEDDQRVVVEAVLLQRGEDLADGPVDLLITSPYEAALGSCP